ncbi:hypothetical protein FACS1894208_02070 [Clostridia bacterium]|nr:hypothetical protein FACS1894208_02070 [Clostridia bacterium]
MVRVDFLIEHKKMTVGAKLSDPDTGVVDFVGKTAFGAYASTPFYNAGLRQSGAGCSLYGTKGPLSRVAAEDLTPQELRRMGLAPEISKLYKGLPKPAVKIPIPEEDKQDEGVPVFDILWDMAVSLQASKYARMFLLKGAFVLMSAVRQHGKNEYVRGTTDLDLDFYSLEVWEKFVGDVCTILTERSQIGATYTLNSRRGVDVQNQSDRLFFDVTIQGAPKTEQVGIDMNVKTLFAGVKYTVAEMSVKGASAYSMLADKLSVLSGRKVLWRVKDLADVYIISKIFSLRLFDIVDVIRRKNREITFPPFILDGDNIEGKQGLRHAYDQQKVSADLNVLFDKLYGDVLSFVTLIYQELHAPCNSAAVWDCERSVWVRARL